MLKTGTFLNIQSDPMAGGTVTLKMMKDMEQARRDLPFLIAKFSGAITVQYYTSSFDCR